jgi:PHD finger protein 12 MRG binding domain
MSNNNMDECSIPAQEEASAIIPETAEITSVEIVEQPVAEKVVVEEVKVVEPEPAAASLMDFQPLDTLIQAAAQLNPKEFELPYEFMEPVPFPGTEKSIPRSRKGKRKPHELDNGFVPLPAKLCHECQK